MKKLKIMVPKNSSSKRPGGVKYLSALDLRDDDRDLVQNGLCTVTFDAVPISILPFLRRATSHEIARDSDTALSFLLMEAQIPKPVFDQAMSAGGWCSITVSDDSSSEDGLYEARAIEFSEEGQESVPTRLYLKINPDVPNAKDLQALKRVIECRHHQSAAFEYLGVQPKNDLFVAVYDVGQANMCAILDDAHRPKAFFDFGWPIRFFRRSLTNCTRFDPLSGDNPDHPAPVFLSHLDWDHWGYAYASGRPVKDVRGFWKTHVTYRPGALQRPWVMRRPSAKVALGISHAHLMYTLQNQVLQDGSCALKFWPSVRARVQWGSCTLFACNPAAGVHDVKYLRNNVALGMLVENPQSYYFRRVLLCGDADYTSIAARFKQDLDGVVAPHHGGRVTPRSTPAPNVGMAGNAFMVFSTHDRCYSGIPSKNTIDEALALGWIISRTDARRPCLCGPGERRNRWFALAANVRPSYSAPYRSVCLCLR